MNIATYFKYDFILASFLYRSGFNRVTVLVSEQWSLEDTSWPFLFIFLAKSDGAVNEKGKRTLHDVY